MTSHRSQFDSWHRTGLLILCWIAVKIYWHRIIKGGDLRSQVAVRVDRLVVGVLVHPWHLLPHLLVLSMVLSA